jgi:DNA-binding transcriptional MerR regulator
MRISELSSESGVPIPTLKFYLREGLLPAGAPQAVNQADYGSDHLRRLRLIGALTEVGGLRLREVRAVLAAIDNERMPLHDLLGTAHYALEGERANTEASPKTEDQVGAQVNAVLKALGWQVDARAPARRSLARTLASLRELGWEVPIEDLTRYGRAVDDLAEFEVDSLPADASRAETVERLVIGTVLFESVLNALRRLGQEHHSSVRFGGAPALSGRRGDGSLPRGHAG